MQRTLIILKPSAIQRGLVGEIISRFQRKGLIIDGMKMMQLDDAILREHYAHLVDKPFFPSLVKSMSATPVIVMCLRGVDAINVVRLMTGSTNGREAAPGTIRGDMSMSNQENVIHASSSEEDAAAEISRFFNSAELFDYTPLTMPAIYSADGK